MKEPFEKPDLLAALFNSVPTMLIIVDSDVKVHTANTSALEFLGKELEDMHKKRLGKIFHCVHSSETKEGCGHSPACPDCIVRNSVQKAMDGKKVVRKRAKLECGHSGEYKVMHLMVSTSPMTYNDKTFISLAIEDISELVQLHRLLPMCTECKKIRDDNQYWRNVEEYIAENSDARFSQALCPGCAKKLYPDVFG